jgi:hypothetical protein
MEVMRRTVLTAALLGGLLVGGAAPATAAPPEREKQSGNYTALESFTSECTPEPTGGETCTNIFLYASTDTSGMDSVSLTIDTYSIDGDGVYTPIDFASGFVEGGSELTVTSDLSATLAPTTVVLETFECTEAGCDLVDSREVTVSASDTRTGPIGKGRDRGTFRDGSCMYKWSNTYTSAEVAGTITLDGVTYDEVGSVRTGDYRVMSLCK